VLGLLPAVLHFLFNAGSALSEALRRLAVINSIWPPQTLNSEVDGKLASASD